MTKLPLFFSALAAALLLASPLARADDSATLGQKVPDFTLQGADGKDHSLSDYKGKFVVLEWTNPDCPFVQKFYNSGTMQKLQKKYTGQGRRLAARQFRRARAMRARRPPPPWSAYEKAHHVHATADAARSHRQGRPRIRRHQHAADVRDQ